MQRRLPPGIAEEINEQLAQWELLGAPKIPWPSVELQELYTRNSPVYDSVKHLYCTTPEEFLELQRQIDLGC